MTHAPLAHVVRSGFVEGVHHGSVVVLGASGEVLGAAGAPNDPVFPRSTNKPLQAVGMVRAGLSLPPHLLALGAASHSGEEYHLDGVRRILAIGGLGPEALDNARDLPLGEHERALWTRLDRAPSRIAQNCSGKHAAMLLTCVQAGWPIAGYRDPSHPLQRAIHEAVTDLAGQAPTTVGIDGCGAPVHALTLTGVARAFAAIATASADSPEGLVAAGIRAHPEWLGGTGREVTLLLRALPGAIGKDGAEGVYAVALPDGRAVALKIADGADRARTVVLAAALQRLGVDTAFVDGLREVPVFGHGETVGATVALEWTGVEPVVGRPETAA